VVEVAKVATEVKPTVVEHVTKAAHVEKPVEPIQAEVTDHHKKEHKQKNSRQERRAGADCSNCYP